jgi:hypothetical protein
MAWRWASTLVALMACGPSAPSPDHLTVAPSWAFNGEETSLTLEGDGLIPLATYNVDDAAVTRPTWRVELRQDGVAVPLAGTDLVREGVLATRVPVGVSPGEWQLWVRSPLGGEGVVPEPFLVVDNRAEGLDVTATALVQRVGETAEVVIRLLDLDGQPIAQDREVEVAFTGPAGAPIDVEVTDFGLDAAALVGTSTLRGQLGADGEARVQFRMSTPEIVTVTAAPALADDRITPDDATLQFEAGDAVGLSFVTPAAGFVADAGVPFDVQVRVVDALGNVVRGQPRTLAFTDTCNSYAWLAEVDGEAVFPWVPRKSTGTAGCTDMQIRVLNGLDGVSTAFEVRPGPVADFVIDVSSRDLVAGDLLAMVVRPVDAFGNPAPWASTIVEVSTAAGPVSDLQCTSASPAFCTMRITSASDAESLVVLDAAGTTGIAPTLRIRPGVAVSATLLAPPLVWTAGADQALEVSLFDVYGNVADPVGVDVSRLRFLDDLNEIDCMPAVASVDRLVAACRLFAARSDAYVSIGWDGRPASAAFPVEVVAGPASLIEVTPSMSVVRAGEPFEVALRVTDAWGNRWHSGFGQTVAVTAPGTGDGPWAATLSAAADAVVPVSVTRRGTWTLAATLGDVVGLSTGVVVGPSAPAALALALSSPWVEVGQRVRLDVELQDAYGNRTDDSVVLSAQAASGRAGPVVLPVANGFGSATLTWSDGAIYDRVDVVGGGLAGALDVLTWRTCADGPTASLRLNGSTAPVACLGPSGQADLSTDFVGSSGRVGDPVSVRAVAVDGGPASAPLAALDRVWVRGSGEHVASGLVVTAGGCGATTEIPLWLGEDDGGAVGPIAVIPAASVATCGAAAVPLGLEIAAATCDGRPAVGATVGVRVEAGALVGAAPTGSGLALVLDGNGEGRLTWTLSDLRSGGVVAAFAGREDGQASGAGVLQAICDDVPPVVSDFSPRGAWATPIDHVEVGFSEPLDPSSVSVDVAWLEPYGLAPSIAEVELDPTGQHVTFWLDAPLVAGSWSFSIDASIRDLSGHALAGRWGPSGEDFQILIGEEVEAPDVLDCAVDPVRFRPDGDDGTGVEADAVDVEITASATGSWWIFEVWDRQGRRIRQDRLSPSGPVDVWRWDGRRDDGRVVPAGLYDVIVTPESSRSTLGVSCVRSVEVDLPF